MAAVNAFNQILIQSPSDIKHQASLVYFTKAPRLFRDGLKLIILLFKDVELMIFVLCLVSRWGGRGEGSTGGEGSVESHLIAYKSQNWLKNCCFSFTFQNTETIFPDLTGGAASSHL